jgi:hypothetical protein
MDRIGDQRLSLIDIRVFQGFLFHAPRHTLFRAKYQIPISP